MGSVVGSDSSYIGPPVIACAKKKTHVEKGGEGVDSSLWLACWRETFDRYVDTRIIEAKGLTGDSEHINLQPRVFVWKHNLGAFYQKKKNVP